MKFKKGDRVAFYKGVRRIGTVTLIPYIPYIVVQDNLGTEHRVHPKQCRLLKPKPFTIGDKVWVKPSWADWFMSHLDIFYYPDAPNKITDENKVETALYCIQSLQQKKLPGKVVGFGATKDDLRVEVDGSSLLELYGTRSVLIGPQDLERRKDD